jgi:hypothetical protein
MLSRENALGLAPLRVHLANAAACCLGPRSGRCVSRFLAGSALAPTAAAPGDVVHEAAAALADPAAEFVAELAGVEVGFRVEWDHTPRVRQLHSRGICYLAREASSARACSKKGLIGTMPHCDPHSDHSLRSSSSLASEASRSSR